MHLAAPPHQAQETPALDLPLGHLGPEDEPVAQVARGRVGLWCGVAALWYRWVPAGRAPAPCWVGVGRDGSVAAP